MEGFPWMQAEDGAWNPPSGSDLFRSITYLPSHDVLSAGEVCVDRKFSPAASLNGSSSIPD
jgi:hypothetical protein